MHKIVFLLTCSLCWPIFRFLFRWQVSGLENVPDGGAIIAPNHQSFWDIPLVGLALFNRRTHFMAKSELFQNPLFGWFIRNLLAFPVKRGAPDRAAVRHAIDMLKQGDLVAIFPEGTRSKTGKLGAAEPGLSLIAAKAEVLVVPVAITGTRDIFSRNSLFPQVKVHFGRPVSLQELQPQCGKGRMDIGAEVMQKIEQLLRQSAVNAEA